MFKFSLFKPKNGALSELSFNFFNQKALGPLTEREQQTVLQYMHKRTYKPNEIIFLEDDPSTGMYTLAEGKVEILCGDEIIDYDAEVGSVFGLFSLDADTKRWYTLRSKTHSVVYGLFKPDFETLVSRDPKLAFKIIRYTNRKATKLLGELYGTLSDKVGKKSGLEILLKHY